MRRNESGSALSPKANTLKKTDNTKITNRVTLNMRVLLFEKIYLLIV
jgi:hypothetical protein